MVYSRSGTTRLGWLKKSKYIDAVSKNEKEIQNRTLYSLPIDEALDKINLAAWKSDFISIEKCKGEWRYVSLIFTGEKVCG